MHEDTSMLPMTTANMMLDMRKVHPVIGMVKNPLGSEGVVRRAILGTLVQK